MAKVIYIAGSGRSGSTVLATILGGHESVISVGELSNISRACTDELEYCACGSRGRDCDYWTKVRNKWQELAGISDLSEWEKLSSRYERSRALPRLLLLNPSTSSEFLQYAVGLAGLFEAISVVSGKQYVVDSSKSPTRALALSMIPRLDVFVIHLIRDPRGVVQSLSKSWEANPGAGIPKSIKSQSTLKAAMEWVFVNQMVEIVKRKLGQSRGMTLRYEDLMADWSNSLQRIGQGVGLNFSGVINRLASGDGFSSGHTLAGNRLRMNRVIYLKATSGVPYLYSKKEQIIYWLIAGLYARRYGY